MLGLVARFVWFYLDASVRSRRGARRFFRLGSRLPSRPLLPAPPPWRSRSLRSTRVPGAIRRLGRPRGRRWRGGRGAARGWPSRRRLRARAQAPGRPSRPPAPRATVVEAAEATNEEAERRDETQRQETTADRTASCQRRRPKDRLRSQNERHRPEACSQSRRERVGPPRQSARALPDTHRLRPSRDDDDPLGKEAGPRGREAARVAREPETQTPPPPHSRPRCETTLTSPASASLRQRLWNDATETRERGGGARSAGRERPERHCQTGAPGRRADGRKHRVRAQRDAGATRRRRRQRRRRRKRLETRSKRNVGGRMQRTMGVSAQRTRVR